MAVPATTGIRCTKLEDMEIGDYIACKYTAPSANVAGTFSDLGGTGTELPTTPGVTANGYFYFLKVDKGLCVADRMIQQISGNSLNFKNYICGMDDSDSLIRTLCQSEWTKYITNGDLKGNIIKQDLNVWHCLSETAPTSSNADNCKYTVYPEYLQDRVNNRIKTAIYISGKSYNANYHMRYILLYESYGVLEIPKFIDYTIVTHNYSATYYGNVISIVTCNSYRPALEFIDNKKSTNIWY